MHALDDLGKAFVQPQRHVAEPIPKRQMGDLVAHHAHRGLRPHPTHNGLVSVERVEAACRSERACPPVAVSNETSLAVDHGQAHMERLDALEIEPLARKRKTPSMFADTAESKPESRRAPKKR